MCGGVGGGSKTGTRGVREGVRGERCGVVMGDIDHTRCVVDALHGESAISETVDDGLE